jgi:hypothetical protein
MGCHGAQEHTLLGRKVEATQPSGKEEVGYQPGRGTPGGAGQAFKQTKVRWELVKDDRPVFLFN